MRKFGRISLAALWLLSLPCLAQAADFIMLHDAWIQAAPPGVRVMAGYLDLENAGDENLDLTGVKSPDVESVEIHRTEIHYGVATMQPQAQVALPAGARVTFRPGDLHLMLIDPKHPLKPGDCVTLILEFGNGEHLETQAEVRQAGGASHHH
jgi:hypothetical protein